MKAAQRAALAEVNRKVKEVESLLCQHVGDGGKLAVVQAPPGSGKTSLLLKVVEFAAKRRRVAVATQTNSQADDICRRLATNYPAVRAIRFASSSAQPVDLGRTIEWQTDSKQLPTGPCVVIGTSAKWGLVNLSYPFDVVLVEEAWQLSWSDFMLLAQVAERFVLIGDPGQISPVVSIDVARWETSPRPPHLAAPKVLLEDPLVRCERWDLPATRRLPSDSAALVQPFYDFDFDATATPEERAVTADRGGSTPYDKVIDLFGQGSVGALTIPTPNEGPPLEEDRDIATSAARLVTRLLARRTSWAYGSSQAVELRHPGER